MEAATSPCFLPTRPFLSFYSAVAFSLNPVRAPSPLHKLFPVALLIPQQVQAPASPKPSRSLTLPPLASFLICNAIIILFAFIFSKVQFASKF